MEVDGFVMQQREETPPTTLHTPIALNPKMAHVTAHDCSLQLSDLEHCSTPNRARLACLARTVETRRAISIGIMTIARVFLEHAMMLSARLLKVEATWSLDDAPMLCGCSLIEN